MVWPHSKDPTLQFLFRPAGPDPNTLLKVHPSILQLQLISPTINKHRISSYGVCNRTPHLTISYFLFRHSCIEYHTISHTIPARSNHRTFNPATFLVGVTGWSWRVGCSLVFVLRRRPHHPLSINPPFPHVDASLKILT